MKRRLIMAAISCVAISSLAIAADDNATDETAIRQVAKDYVTYWNKHDLNAFANLFTEDAEWVNVVGHIWRGKTVIKKVH
jgi:ketosteroid isomerase-like protein